MPTAFLFDLDDTLYPRSAPFLEGFSRTFKNAPAFDPDKLYHSFLKFGDEVFEDSMQGRITMEEMYIYRISHAAETIGLHPDAETSLAFQDSYNWALKHLHLSDTLTTMMQNLYNSSVFIGIITNGPSQHQRDKFYAMDLGRWIPDDHILASGDIGISKPDTRIMSQALSRWHLMPDETWYIGDNFAHDIVCSAQVGLHTIWFDRSHPSHQSGNDDTVTPDITVHSEAELASAIAELIQVR